MVRWMVFLAASQLLLFAFMAINAGDAQCAQTNLVENSSFEGGLGEKWLPRGWWLWEQEPGQVTCAIDDAVSHSGGKSFRMNATKDSNALLVAPKIPITEGEVFKISIWVKTDKLEADSSDGKVVVNAAFLRSNGTFLFFKKLGKMIPSGEWQQISGEAVVPGEVSDMTMEIGLKDARGTVWFDDVSIIAKNPYSIRSSTNSTLVPPGKSSWPVDVVNRGGDNGAFIVKTMLDSKAFSKEVQLNGSRLQKIEVPIETGASGPVEMKFQLADKNSGKTLAESSRKARVLDAVEMEPLVPTHFCIEDGKPELEARVWNNLAEGEATGVEVTLKSAAGNVLERVNVQHAKSGWQDIRLSSDKASLGDYQVEVKLTDRSGKTFSAAQPWHIIHRSHARVVFNEAGFPVADGKPIFPLGTFNSGRYDLMKQTGFNTTHAWNRMKLAAEGDRTNNQLAKDYLDESEKAGLKAIGFLHVAFMERQDWNELRRRIRMFRNHPALLAWDQEEGVARGEVKIAAMEKMAKIVREEDPNHPFVLADSYDEITRVDRTKFFREDLMDGGMWWYYPIPLNPNAKASALEGEEESDGLTLKPPVFLVSTKKPLWVGMQAYSPERAGGRLPTPAEHRCMAYLSVLNGAKGLIYYMGGSAWIMEGCNDKRPWGYLQDLVPELNDMIPVFMAPEAAGQVKVAPAGADIDTALKLIDGEFTLIAVNRSDKDINAAIDCSTLGSKGINVLFESRVLDSKSGEISDHFKPYDVHVYRWKAE